MGDTESCSSRAIDSMTIPNRKQRLKLEVYTEILRRLKDSNEEEAREPGFEDELWTHFQRLPNRYAMDVNADRAGDVLMHKRLLLMAHDPSNRPAIEVRLVQVHSAFDGTFGGSFNSTSPREVDVSCADHLCNQRHGSNVFFSGMAKFVNTRSTHPPPAFGLPPDLELVHGGAQDKDIMINANQLSLRIMHEITISTNDKPKLLSQLTSLLSEIGLNIQEAHAFSTTDGFSLDVFVVDGWALEETDQLRNELIKEMRKIEKHSWSKGNLVHPLREQEQARTRLISDYVRIPADGIDVWQIDTNLLIYEKKIASGSSTDLYKGTYCSQDVAVKILRMEHLSEKLQKEFAQEIFIMRKVRHKNVVRFIGYCGRPPNLCVVTEYMSGGSIHDFLHKQKGVLKLPSLLRVAIDVSKGMNYLHQNKIIHRDLKAANLLMDENGVVKVADFGVARIQPQSGVMTAETGTYRWMAPEVIEHKPYDQKADVFSFGIVLWELLSGMLPYEHLTPLQAAIGVIQQGLRPTIPKNTCAELVELLERCWHQEPSLRPEFNEIVECLQILSTRFHDIVTQVS